MNKILLQIALPNEITLQRGHEIGDLLSETLHSLTKELIMAKLIEPGEALISRLPIIEITASKNRRAQNKRFIRK